MEQWYIWQKIMSNLQIEENEMRGICNRCSLLFCPLIFRRKIQNLFPCECNRMVSSCDLWICMFLLFCIQNTVNTRIFNSFPQGWKINGHLETFLRNGWKKLTDLLLFACDMLYIIRLICYNLKGMADYFKSITIYH